jgi:hypothetical protein
MATVMDSQRPWQGPGLCKGHFLFVLFPEYSLILRMARTPVFKPPVAGRSARGLPDQQFRRNRDAGGLVLAAVQHVKDQRGRARTDVSREGVDRRHRGDGDAGDLVISEARDPEPSRDINSASLALGKGPEG